MDRRTQRPPSAPQLALVSVSEATAVSRDESARPNADGRAACVIGVLLAAAWLTLDGALSNRLWRDSIAWPHSAAAIGLGVFFAQMALLGMWVALSRQYWTVRIAVGGVALYVLARMSAALVGEPARGASWFLLLGICLILVSVMLVVRTCSGWPRRASDPQVTAGRSGGTWQFSLASLLDLTTAVALVCGFWQWTRLSPKPLSHIVLFCVVTAIVSQIALTISVNWRARVLLWAFSLAVAPLAAYALVRTGLPPRGWTPLTLMVASQVTAIHLSLAAIATARDADPGHSPSSF